MPGAAYQSRLEESTRLAGVGYQSRLANTEEEASPERYAIGDVIDGRYEVLAIHRGTMGVVYGTFDRETGLPRALKGLQRRFDANTMMRDLFTAEATTWVRLEKHPFIVRAHLVRRFDDQPYVITEYIRGQEGMAGDLRGWLGHPRLTLPVGAEMALQIAQGMQHATRRVPCLVHRDLKPANILVDDRMRAMVTDFGLAHAAEADAGTPAYMAPEQWRREELDQRADLYAFGCILHEILTGRRLFAAVSINDWRTAHLSYLPVSPRVLKPDLPATLDDLVRRCLSKEIAARPADWDEVVSVCARAFHEVTGQPAVLSFSAYELTADELLMAASSLGILGKHQEALDVCDRALQVHPRSLTAWALKGLALEDLKRHADAVACYDRALEIEPRVSALWRNKGRALHKLERYAEAITCYARAIEIDPLDTTAWYKKGNALNKLRNIQEAIACYDRTLEIDPRNTSAWRNKGFTLHTLKRYNEAIACYDFAIEIDPRDTCAFGYKGNTLQALKRYEEAIACYDGAIEINPRDTSAWRNKADTLKTLKRYNEALVCYDRTLEIDPRDLSAWRNKGRALDALERHEEAITCYDRAIEIDPRNTLTWGIKGFTLAALKRYKEAIACYDRAIENPENAWMIELRNAAQKALTGQPGRSSC